MSARVKPGTRRLSHHLAGFEADGTRRENRFNYTKILIMTKTPGPKNSNSKRAVNRKEAIPSPKRPKRANTFSKSRDTREDRGVRQMKTPHNSQTLPHGR